MFETLSSFYASSMSHFPCSYTFFFFVFKDFIYLFLERGREGEREGEKYQCVLASCVASNADLACNPGTGPDWESNQRSFGLQPTLNPLSYTSQGSHFIFQANLWKAFYNKFKMISKSFQYSKTNTFPEKKGYISWEIYATISYLKSFNSRYLIAFPLYYWFI